VISSAALGSVLAAEGVVNGIFQSLVLSVAGWAGLRVFKRLSAPLRSGILFTLLVLLALLPFRMIFLRSAPPSSIRIPLSTVRTESSEMSGVPLMGIKDRAGVERASRAVARTSPEPERAPGFESAPASSSLPFHPVLAGLNLFGLIWIAGFLFSFGRLLHGIRFLLGFKNGLREIRDEKSAEAFEIIRASFPGRTLPSLYASLSAQSPLAFGIFRPAIVVPQSLYHHLSRAELQSVLIHETAHIWHKDHLSGLLQRLVTAVYWWNPLARILSAEYSVVREQVSDNYAIRKDGARSYARCLVALAQKTTLMTRLPLVVGMATPRFSFEKRIIGIVSEKRALKTKLGRRAVVCLATAAVFTMAILGTFAWTLGPDGRFSKTIPLPVDIDPQSLTVDKDWLYIHNSKHNLTPKDPMDIKIFSQKDFSLFKTFDRRGEGQGEFLTAPGRLQIVGDSLWIENFRKFEVFSKDGSYLKTTTIPEDLWLLEYPLLPVGDHFVGFVVSRDDIRRGIHRYYGRTYDKDFRFVKQFYDDIPFVTPPPPPPPPPPP
jgi:beta-lactamase regulating signal transducer with metallopeptidase domain